MNDARSFLSVAPLRGALLSCICASLAAAQTPTWIEVAASDNDDAARAVANDGSGGMYVLGNTQGDLAASNAGLVDVWLAHYDALGIQLWAIQLGTSAFDFAATAVPDGIGGVYVGGSTGGNLGGSSAGNGGGWLARYDGAGNQRWLHQFGASDGVGVLAATPDGAGGLLVTGRTTGDFGGPSSGDRDVWVARYDGAGNQTWIDQLGSDREDQVHAAAADGSGGVYVCGETRGALGGPSAGNSDAWLAHYDASGNQLWLRQLGTGNPDLARGAAPDDAGGVYITGWTGGSLGGPNAGDYDAWLARYDSAGNQVWILQLGTDEPEWAFAAASDDSGGVFIGGQTGGDFGDRVSGGYDAWLARYDRNGSQVWLRQFGSTSTDSLLAAAPDGLGGVHLGGMTLGSIDQRARLEDAFLLRVDSQGSLPLDRPYYCDPAATNSTGQSAEIVAGGSTSLFSAGHSLFARQFPLNTFGYFLTSRTQGMIANPGGSQGTLCLGGEIGRLVGPSQTFNTGGGGFATSFFFYDDMPQPGFSVAVQPGETWNFQAWYRDANPMPTSNFSDAISLTFY